MIGRDGLAGLVVLATSLALFWLTLGLQRNPLVPIGPGFYPRIVLGVTAALGLALVVADLVARRRKAGVAAAAAPRNYRLVALSFGATLDEVANLDLAYAPPYNGAIDAVHQHLFAFQVKQA